MKRKKTRNRSIGIASFLVIAVLLTTGLSTGIYSAYRTYKTENEKAFVAKFVIEGEAVSNPDIEIDCTDENALEKKFDFVIRNMNGGIISNVSVDYNISLEFPDEIPEGLSFIIDGVEPQEKNERELLYKNNEWKFRAGKGNSKTHSLSIKANKDVVMDDIDISGIKVDVHATQVK